MTEFNKSNGLLSQNATQSGYHRTGGQSMNPQDNYSSLSQNPASLKAKLHSIDMLVKNISDELSMHKKELAILRSEKDTLEGVLSMKQNDVQKTLQGELNRLEDEMKRHFQFQFAENNNLQTNLNNLKQEKMNIQQNLIQIQRRISDLEIQIGELDKMNRN